MKLPTKRSTPAEGFGQSLVDILKDKDIPADKLQIVLQMQRELIAERRVEAFQAAFVELSAELPQVEKHGWVDLGERGAKRGGYAFAKWEDMDTAIRPVLVRHGFALTFAETPSSNGHIHMRGSLMHNDGHAIHAERTMPPDTGPGRSASQAQGSAISYAKRYLAEELLNIVRKDVDNDAVDIGLLTPAQALELDNLLEVTGTNPERFLAMFVTGCERVEDIPARDFVRLKNTLEQRRRDQQK